VSHATSRRLFFAFWPDEALRAAVMSATHATRATVLGRSVPGAELHVTLAFLGRRPTSELPALIGAARELPGRPFRLHFAGIEYWPGPRVLAAVADQGSAAAAALAAALWQRLGKLGLEPEARPYRAHITLMRSARATPPPALTPFDWPVDSVTLVESQVGAGARYRPLATTELGQ
jgi:RNA 2',3'-cyclic 3'-phosphodiesterase